jgi:hypothetical protein
MDLRRRATRERGVSRPRFFVSHAWPRCIATPASTAISAHGGDAGDRIPQQSIARRVRDRGRRLSPRTAGNGFVEGRNIAIAFRWADGRYDSLPTLAAELVDLPVSLIFAAGGPPTAFAVKAATSTIPIVFSAVRGKTHRADERIDAYGNFDWLFAESGRSDVGLRIEGRTRSGTRSGGRAQGPQRQFRRRARNASQLWQSCAPMCSWSPANRFSTASAKGS